MSTWEIGETRQVGGNVPEGWVQVTHDVGNLVVQHRLGVPWYEAKLPRRLHHCRVQTRGGDFGRWDAERCACGAIRRFGTRHWFDRNSSRKVKTWSLWDHLASRFFIAVAFLLTPFVVWAEVDGFNWTLLIFLGACWFVAVPLGFLMDRAVRNA